MENKEIRELARVKDVRFWQIARAIGCAPGTLSVWLRDQLSDEKRELIIRAIEDVSAAKG